VAYCAFALTGIVGLVCHGNERRNEAIEFTGAGDCFVAALLAMTGGRTVSVKNVLKLLVARYRTLAALEHHDAVVEVDGLGGAAELGGSIR
jgi:hypothetical protein